MEQNITIKGMEHPAVPSSDFRFVYGLNPFVSYLSAQGIAYEPMLHAVGLTPKMLYDPNARMSLGQELRFTAAVVETTGRPDLGLRIGPRYNLSTFGMLGLAMLSSRSLAEALEIGIALNPLTWSRFRWRVLEVDDLAICEAQEYEELGVCRRFMLDRDFSACFLMCEQAMGLRFPLKHLKLTTSKPKDASLYVETFGCDVEFDAEINALYFDAALLRKELPQANAAIKHVCTNQCNRLMQQFQLGQSTTCLVENLLLNGEGIFLTLKQVADQLNVSARTLRRNLSREQVTFQGLVNKLRCRIAKEMISNSNQTIESIAARLGYSEAAGFCHAFKRWTGKRPSDFR